MYFFKSFTSTLLSKLAGLTPEEALVAIDKLGTPLHIIRLKIVDAINGKVDSYYFEEKNQLPTTQIINPPVKRGADIPIKEKFVLSKSDYLSDKDISALFPKTNLTSPKSTSLKFKNSNNVLDFSDNSKNIVEIDQTSDDLRKAKVFTLLTEENPLLASCSPRYLELCRQELEKFTSHENIDKIQTAMALVSNSVYFYNLEFRAFASPKYLVTNRSPQKDLVIPKFSQSNPRPLTSDEFGTMMILKYKFKEDWKKELIGPSLKYFHRSIEIGEEFDSRHCSYDETSGVGSDCPFRSVFSHIFQMSFLNKLNFNLLRNFFKFPIGTILVVEFVEYLCMKLGLSMLLVSNMTTTITFVSEEFAFIHHASAHYSRMNSTNEKTQYSSCIFRNISDDYVPNHYLRKDTAHHQKFNKSLLFIKESKFNLKKFVKPNITMQNYGSVINFISKFVNEIKLLSLKGILRENLFSVLSFGVEYWDRTLTYNAFIPFRITNLMNQILDQHIFGNVIFLDNLSNPVLDAEISTNIPQAPLYDKEKLKSGKYRDSIPFSLHSLPSLKLTVKSLKMAYKTNYDSDTQRTKIRIEELETRINLMNFSYCLSLIETGAYIKSFAHFHLLDYREIIISDDEIQCLVNVTNSFRATLETVDRSNIFMGYIKKTQVKRSKTPDLSLLRQSLLNHKNSYLTVMIELVIRTSSIYQNLNENNNSYSVPFPVDMPELDSTPHMKHDIDVSTPDDIDYEIPDYLFQEPLSSLSESNNEPPTEELKTPGTVKREAESTTLTVEMNQNAHQLSDNRFVNQKFRESIEILISDPNLMTMGSKLTSIEDKFCEIEKSDECKRSSNLCIRLLRRFVKVFETEIRERPGSASSDEVLKFITGSILKLRVAIISNSLMDIFNRAETTDIKFSVYFPGLSRRTPDYIFKDETKKECMVLETSYSSKRAKGIIAKGYSIQTSKYYEELYCIQEMGYKITYLPMIFYDKMPLNEYLFLNYDNSNKSYSSNQEKLFFGCFHTLKQTFSDSFDIQKLRQFIQDMEISFKVNDMIYPSGRLLNRALTDILSRRLALQADFYRYSYVVEYNYYLLISIEPRFSRFPKSVIDHIFKKRFSILDQISLTILRDQFHLSSRFAYKIQFTSLDEFSDSNFKFSEIINMFSPQFFTVEESSNLDYARYCGISKIKKMYEHYCSVSHIDSSNMSFTNFVKIKPEQEYTNYDISRSSGCHAQDVPLKFWREYLKDAHVKEKKNSNNLKTQEIKIDEDSSVQADYVEFKPASFPSSIDISELIKNKKEKKRSLSRSLSSLPISSLISFLKHRTLQGGKSTILKLTKNVLFIDYSSEVNLFSTFKNYPSIAKLYCSGFTFRILETPGFLDLLTVESMIESQTTLGEDDLVIFKNYIVFKNFFSNEPKNLKITGSDTHNAIKFSRESLDPSLVVEPLDVDDLAVFRTKFSNIRFFEKSDNKEENLSWKNMRLALEDYPIDETKEESYKRYVKSIELIPENFTPETQLVNPGLLLSHINSYNMKDNRKLTGVSIGFSFNLEDFKHRCFEFEDKSKLLNEMLEKSHKKEKRLGPFTLRSGQVYKKSLLDTDGYVLLDINKEKDNLIRELTNRFSDLKDKSLFSTTYKRNLISYSQNKRMTQRRIDEKSYKKHLDHDKCVRFESLEEIDNYGEYLDRLSKSCSSNSYEFLEVTEHLYAISQDESFKIGDEILSGVLSNDTVRSFYEESMLCLSLSMKTQFKHSRSYFSLIEEGFNNRVCLLFPSDGGDKIRYSFVTYGYYDIRSKYKNSEIEAHKGDSKGFLMTNMITDSAETLYFKYQLFFTLLQQSIILYNRGLSIESLKKFFIMNYELLSSMGKNTKLMLSIFKYLNVIQFTDFSRVEDLIKKYLMSNIYVSEVQSYFAKSVIDNYNYNFLILEKIRKDENSQLVNVRDLTSKVTLKLFSMCGEVSNFQTLVMCNSFYSYVFKDTTQLGINYVNFYRTIVKNNEETRKFSGLFSSNENFRTNEKRIYDTLLQERPCFYDENIIFHSMELMKKDLSRIHGDKFSSRVLSDKIVENFKEDIIDEFSQSFLSARKSLYFDIRKLTLKEKSKKNDRKKKKSLNKGEVKLFEDSKGFDSFNIRDTNKIDKIKKILNIKQTVMRSTMDFMTYMRDKYDSSKVFDPIEIFNSLIEIITNPESYKDLVSYFNLSINSKKAQYEDDREIYIIHITMKMMLFYVQSVFKTINLLIPSEMVVRSVGQKLHEIKEMSQISLSNSYLDTETVFANGDMAAWSGTDIEEKFRFLSIMLVKSWGVDPKICSLLTLVLECCKEMKIIINPSISEHILNPEILNPLDENPDVKYIYLMDSWGQGLYHNISSFVHTLELIWRKNCLLTRTLEICDNDFEREESKYIGEGHPLPHETKKGLAFDPDEMVYVEELNEYFSRFDLISRIRDHRFPNNLASKYYPHEHFISEFAKEIFIKLGLSGYESSSFLKRNFRSFNIGGFTKDEQTCLKISFSDPYNLVKMRRMESWTEIPRYTSFQYLSENVTEYSSQFKFVSNDKRNLFNYLLKKVSQISHSDDKNEVYNIQLRIYNLIIKYSDYGTLYFSLKTSKTKNSFSRFVSEMVGLQNIQGFLFDNPIKVISGAMTTISEPDFINNNKSLLSRYLDYYRKSSDEVSSTIMYRLGYSLLVIRYGLRDYLKERFEFKKLVLLPIDFGGLYIGRFRSLAHYGSYSDLVTKDLIYSTSGGYIFSELYNNKKTLKRFLMKNTYESLSKFYTDYTGMELSGVSTEIFAINSRLVSSEFIKNIADNAVKTRKEMFVNHGLRYNLTNLLHYKKSKYKIKEISDVAIMDIYTYLKTSIHYFKPKLENQTGIDQFCVDPEIVPRILKEESFTINVSKNRNLVQNSPFFDCRGFNIRAIKNDFSLGSLSYLTIKDLSMRKFSKVFNDYRNSQNMEKIIDTYNKLLRAFNIHSLEDVSSRRGEIERWNEYIVNKKDHIFVNYDAQSKDLNYETEDINIEEKSSFLLMDKMNFKLMIMDRSRYFSSIYEKFKEIMNKYLLEYNVDYLEKINKDIFSQLQDDSLIKDFIRFTKDDNVKHFWRYWNQSSTIMPVIIDPTAPPPYKFRFLMRNEDCTIYLIKSSKVIVDILIIIKNEKFFCCKISFNNLAHYQFKHLKVCSDANITDVTNALGFVKEAGLSIRYDINSLKLKDIRKTLLISPTFNIVRNSPIKNGRVFVTSVEGSYYYSFKPYIEYVDVFLEEKAFLLKTSTKVKFTPVTDKNLQAPNNVVTFRRPVKYSRFDLMKISKEFISFCKLHSYQPEFTSFLSRLRIITFYDKSLLNSRQPYLFLHTIPNIPESQNFAYKMLKQKFEDSRDLDSMTLIKMVLDPFSVFIDDVLLSRHYPLKVVDGSQKNDMMLEVSDGYDPVTFVSLCFTIYCAFSDPESPGNKAFNLNHKKILISFHNSMMSIILNSENFVNCEYHALDATILMDLVRFISTGGSVKSYQNQVVMHAVKFISVLSEQYRVEQTSFDFDYKNEYFLREDVKFFLNPTEDIIEELNEDLKKSNIETTIWKDKNVSLGFDNEFLKRRSEDLNNDILDIKNKIEKLSNENNELKEIIADSEYKLKQSQAKEIEEMRNSKLREDSLMKQTKEISERSDAQIQFLQSQIDMLKGIDHHERCREKEDELMKIIQHLRDELSDFKKKISSNSSAGESIKKLLSMKITLISEMEMRIVELEEQLSLKEADEESEIKRTEEREEQDRILKILRDSVTIDREEFIAEVKLPFEPKHIKKYEFNDRSMKSCIAELSYFGKVQDDRPLNPRFKLITKSEFSKRSAKSCLVEVIKLAPKQSQVSFVRNSEVSTITYNTVLAHVPQFIVEKFNNLTKDIYSDNNYFAKKKPSNIIFNVALMIVKNSDSLSHLKSFQNLRNDVSIIIMISCGLDVVLYETIVSETDKINNGNVTMFWAIVFRHTNVKAIGKFLSGAMTAENERICRSYYRIKRLELEEYIVRMSKVNYKVSYLIWSEIDNSIEKVEKTDDDLNWMSVRKTDSFDHVEVAVDFRIHTVGKMPFFGIKYNAEGFETRGRFNFAGRCYISNVDVINPEFSNQVLDRRDNLLMPVSIRKIVSKPNDYKASLPFPIYSDNLGRIVLVRRLFVEIDGLSFKKDYLIDKTDKKKPSEIDRLNKQNVALIQTFMKKGYEISFCGRRKLRILKLDSDYIHKIIKLRTRLDNGLEISDYEELKKNINLDSIEEFRKGLAKTKAYSNSCLMLIDTLMRESDKTYDARFCLVVKDNQTIEDVDQFVIEDQLDTFRIMTADLRKDNTIDSKLKQLKTEEIYGEVMCVRMSTKKLWAGIDLGNKEKTEEKKLKIENVGNTLKRRVFKGGRSPESLKLKGKTIEEIREFLADPVNLKFDYFQALRTAVEQQKDDYWEILRQK
jgi:hypothetical protein